MEMPKEEEEEGEVVVEVETKEAAMEEAEGKEEEEEARPMTRRGKRPERPGSASLASLGSMAESLGNKPDASLALKDGGARLSPVRMGTTKEKTKTPSPPSTQPHRSATDVLAAWAEAESKREAERVEEEGKREAERFSAASTLQRRHGGRRGDSRRGRWHGGRRRQRRQRRRQRQRRRRQWLLQSRGSSRRFRFHKQSTRGLESVEYA